MRILVVRPDHIGDMILTTPFLTVLKSSFPEWQVSVLCGSWSLPVLRNNPNCDEIIQCDFPWLARGQQASWSSLFNTVRKLRSQKYDIVFNLRKAAKSAVVTQLIGGATTWGFDVAKSSWAFSQTIPYRTDIHIADLYCDFIAHLQEFSGSITHRGLELYLDEKDVQSLEKSTPIPDRFVVCSPGAGYSEKHWFADRWAGIADWVTHSLKLTVIFTGGSGERALIQEIISKMNENSIDVSGKLSIREAAVLADKASFVVSVDSAMMHIASAVKTPVIALFGPTNPDHWGPYPNGKSNCVLSKIHTFNQGRGSTNRSGGMSLITVKEVQNAILEVCKSEKLDKTE